MWPCLHLTLFFWVKFKALSYFSLLERNTGWLKGSLGEWGVPAWATPWRAPDSSSWKVAMHNSVDTEWQEALGRRWACFTQSRHPSVARSCLTTFPSCLWEMPGPQTSPLPSLSSREGLPRKEHLSAHSSPGFMGWDTHLSPFLEFPHGALRLGATWDP